MKHADYMLVLTSYKPLFVWVCVIFMRSTGSRKKLVWESGAGGSLVVIVKASSPHTAGAAPLPSGQPASQLLQLFLPERWSPCPSSITCSHFRIFIVAVGSVWNVFPSDNHMSVLLCVSKSFLFYCLFLCEGFPDYSVWNYYTFPLFHFSFLCSTYHHLTTTNIVLISFIVLILFIVCLPTL